MSQFDQVFWQFSFSQTVLAFFGLPSRPDGLLVGLCRWFDLKFYSDQVRSFVAPKASDPECSRITWANREHINLWGCSVCYSFKSTLGRIGEHSLSLKGSSRTKPDQLGHIIKLFFQILGAHTLVTASGQLVFRFPTKGHKSAKIRYFEPIRTFMRFS
jgi:hypothetical protein